MTYGFTSLAWMKSMILTHYIGQCIAFNFGQQNATFNESAHFDVMFSMELAVEGSQLKNQLVMNQLNLCIL